MRGWLVIVTCTAGCRQIFGIGQPEHTSDAAMLVIDLDPVEAPSWIQQRELSVLLTPSVGGVTIAPQVQFPTVDGACNPTQARVTLRATACM